MEGCRVVVLGCGRSRPVVKSVCHARVPRRLLPVTTTSPPGWLRPSRSMDVARAAVTFQLQHVPACFSNACMRVGPCALCPMGGAADGMHCRMAARAVTSSRATWAS